MKIRFYLLLSILIISCSKESDSLQKDLTSSNFPQKWSLYMTTSGFSNSATFEEDLKYQQYYIFGDDSTFLKIKIEDGQTLSEEGIFHLDLNDENIAYRLEFDEDNELIQSCSVDKTEFLYLDDNGEILLNSWWNCDGTGQFYKQVHME